MKTKLLLLPFVLFAIKQSCGQTILPTTLACSEILSLSGSPYIINASITIQPNCSLTVNPGVEIKMAENTHLIVKGKVDFLGTVSQPIYIHAQDTIWGNIFLDSTSTQKSTFKYVNIENARNSTNINHEPAAIYGYFSALEINNCHFTNNLRCISLYQCPNVAVKSCTLDSTNNGEKIHGQYCDGAVVDGSLLYFTAGDCDAIDFDASKNVMLSNNYIYGGGDDGIDIGQADSVGCDSVVIQGNYIVNMLNKGISNGELCTNININHNIIVGCALGIGAKSGAQVAADHNTLFHNRVGINSYHHLNQNWGSGHLTVTNCIISASDTTWMVDSTSFLSVSYSLSDVDSIPGTENSIGDPMFVSPIDGPTGDFHLMPLSAAIDKGDPAFALDPDGSRSDIGRYYLDQNTSGITSHNNSEYELIYPNPGNGTFTVQFSPDYKINRLIVLNALGKIIAEHEFFGNKTEYQIDLSTQSPGVYYLRFYSKNSIATQKAIIY